MFTHAGELPAVCNEILNGLFCHVSSDMFSSASIELLCEINYFNNDMNDKMIFNINDKIILFRYLCS